VKLYSYWRSSSAWRVRTVLEWKRLPYEYVPVNIAPGVSEQGAEPFGAVNPLRQVPTLEWTEAASVYRISQSVAIVEYLEERYPEPSLHPVGALSRAWMREAVEIVNAGTQPLQNLATLAAVRQAGGDDAANAFGRRAVEKGLAALEARARERGARFSVGDAPTLADVYLVPQLYNARRLEVDLSPYPTLLAIEERALGLEAFARAHPERQPDAPSSGGG
jgi:maleylpyruvate isomerase